MADDKQAAYSPGAHDWVKINVGRVSEAQVKAIGAELRRLWQYLDILSPHAEIRASKDASGQYYIHLNGRALTYLMLFSSNLAPEPLTDKQQQPMPPDFLLPK